MVTSSDAATERSQPDYTWDFCGGHLAVDFTNTVGSREDTPEEHFSTFGDVVSWAETRQVISRSRAARLRTYASADPAAARRDFRRAIELREALYRVMAARARGRAPQRDDLAALNRFVQDVLGRTAIVASGEGLALETPTGEGLDVVLHPIVRAAVDLLTASDPPRLKLCADETCAWLFLDSTRSGTRRWCDMKVCGNRQKVRRFRSNA